MSWKLGLYSIKQEVKREARRVATLATQAKMTLDEVLDAVTTEYKRLNPDVDDRPACQCRNCKEDRLDWLFEEPTTDP